MFKRILLKKKEYNIEFKTNRNKAFQVRILNQKLMKIVKLKKMKVNYKKTKIYKQNYYQIKGILKEIDQSIKWELLKNNSNNNKGGKNLINYHKISQV